MCGLASCSSNCLQPLLMQFSTCDVSMQMFNLSTACKVPFLCLTLHSVHCTEGRASKSNLEIYTLQTFHNWIFINQGSHRKIHSKFTNFSQTFAIWGKKATQRYATLPHIW